MSPPQAPKNFCQVVQMPHLDNLHQNLIYVTLGTVVQMPHLDHLHQNLIYVTFGTIVQMSHLDGLHQNLIYVTSGHPLELLQINKPPKNNRSKVGAQQHINCLVFILLLHQSTGQNCLENARRRRRTEVLRNVLKILKSFGPNQWFEGYPFGKPQIQNKEHCFTPKNKRLKVGA